MLCMLEPPFTKIRVCYVCTHCHCLEVKINCDLEQDESGTAQHGLGIYARASVVLLR